MDAFWLLMRADDASGCSEYIEQLEARISDLESARPSPRTTLAPAPTASTCVPPPARGATAGSSASSSTASSSRSTTSSRMVVGLPASASSRPPPGSGTEDAAAMLLLNLASPELGPVR